MNTLFDDFRASLHSIWHRRWLALAVAWAVCLIGWLVVAMVPNSYESRARIFVQLYDPLAAQVGIGDADRKHDIDRVRDTLSSSVHLEKVIRSTRLGENVTTAKQMESAVAGLGKAIKISATQDNLFEISAKSSSMKMSDAENAKLSRQIVEKMIDIFREENMSNNVGEMKQTLQFLDQQLAGRQLELQAAEQRRLAFEAKHPELAQGGVSLIQRLESNRQEMRSLDGDIIAAQSGIAAVGAQLATTPQTIAGVGPTGGARGMLAQAQADLASMRARGLTENHPDVIAARNQISALRGQVSAEGNGNVANGMPNPAYATLESIRVERAANVQALQARRAAVESDVAQVTAMQMANPELGQEAQNISRDYDVLKTQYDKLLRDREEMRLRGQVQSAHGAVKFQVIDPPVTPRAPTAPNRPMLLLVVLLAGVGAGLGVAFAAGELRSTFATTSKLERSVGLPVLGAVSQALSPAGQANKARQVRHFFAASAALGGLFVLLMAMEFIQRGMVA